MLGTVSNTYYLGIDIFINTCWGSSTWFKNTVEVFCSTTVKRNLKSILFYVENVYPLTFNLRHSQ